MDKLVQQACIDEIYKLWLETEENFRPYSVWVAEYQPVSIDCCRAETAVNCAWLINEYGIEKRSAHDYVRFITVQSGAHWDRRTSSFLPCAVFNDRPFHIHSIGLASFASVQKSEMIYLDFIWGGTFGRGAHYNFDEERKLIVCIENIWIS